jgi:predicted nucleotidyltransferase
MPSRDSVIRTLRAHESELRGSGVIALYLFGSLARNEAVAGSDIDLFFDHDPGLGLEVVTIGDQVRSMFEDHVDITTRGSLHPRLRDQIEASAVRIF